MHTVQIMCDGIPLLRHCRVALTFWEKGRGLLARPEIYAKDGLLLWNTNAVHMLGMRYPITAVSIAADGEIRKVRRLTPGLQFFIDRKACHILECDVGSYEMFVALRGERLQIVDAEIGD